MIKDTIKLWRSLSERGDKGTPLQFRLFAFFACFVIVIIMIFTIILSFSGIMSLGAKSSYNFLDSQLTSIKSDIENDFGILSFKGIDFAEQVTSDINKSMTSNGFDGSQLQSHPDALEDILGREMGISINTINSNTCSGVFIILDATVNPNIQGSEYSRAGIFIKKTEPRGINYLGSKNHYLRGPASIARSNGIELLGQWKMEFNIKNQGFFNKVLKATRQNINLPLSRLYYYSERTLLVGNNEAGILLCYPLIDGNNNVYGICGFEISTMMFKRFYSPLNNTYPSVFSVMAPVADDKLFMKKGLTAGNSYKTNAVNGDVAAFKPYKERFYSYINSDGRKFGGLHEQIKLYPADSPYSSTLNVVSVMMSQSDLNKAISGSSKYIYLGAFLLIIISVLMALYISKRYLRPVMETLDLIKSDNYSSVEKTKYMELNDLLDYLKSIDNSGEKKANLSAYKEFVKNIESLSPAERSVFNLYMKGYTTNEIVDELCLSINTVKTHNRRIFTKLNVSNRKELMVFVEMMSADARRAKEDKFI